MSKHLAVMALLTLSLSHSTFADDEWDGSLMPVQSARVILPLECRASSRLEWSDEISGLTYGLRKGEPVWAFTRKGKRKVELGDLSCFVGECKGNYVSIALNPLSEKDVEVFAVSPLSFTEEYAAVVPIEALKRKIDGSCSQLQAGIRHEQFPEVVPERECTILDIGAGNYLQIAAKGFMQENGWVLHMAVASVLKRNGEQFRTLGTTELDQDTTLLTPALAFRNRDGGLDILWHKSSGICCPSRLTLRLSRIAPDGSLQFGRAYSAGGQPCD